jgi:hypothetical protein
MVTLKVFTPDFDVTKNLGNGSRHAAFLSFVFCPRTALSIILYSKSRLQSGFIYLKLHVQPLNFKIRIN